jgi:hypothetical protein
MDPVSAIMTVINIAMLIKAQISQMQANFAEAANLATRLQTIANVLEKIKDNDLVKSMDAGTIPALLADVEKAQEFCGLLVRDKKSFKAKSLAKNFFGAGPASAQLSAFNKCLDEHLQVIQAVLGAANLETATETRDLAKAGLAQQAAMDAKVDALNSQMEAQTAALMAQFQNMQAMLAGAFTASAVGGAGAAHSKRAKRQTALRVTRGGGSASAPLLEGEEGGGEGEPGAPPKPPTLALPPPPPSKIIEIATHQIIVGMFFAGVACAAQSPGARVGIFVALPLLPALIITGVAVGVSVRSNKLLAEAVRTVEATRAEAAHARGETPFSPLAALSASARKMVPPELAAIAATIPSMGKHVKDAWGIYVLYFAPSLGALVSLSLFSFFGNEDGVEPEWDFNRTLPGIVIAVLLYAASLVAR